jgi:hypothetical protein
VLQEAIKKMGWRRRLLVGDLVTLFETSKNQRPYAALTPLFLAFMHSTLNIFSFRLQRLYKPTGP